MSEIRYQVPKFEHRDEEHRRNDLAMANVCMAFFAAIIVGLICEFALDAPLPNTAFAVVLTWAGLYLILESANKNL